MTDFYAAYDHYPGPHQRCWAHLLRDVADLERLQPADAAVAAWAAAVRRVYRAARDDPGPDAGLGAGAQIAHRGGRQRHHDAELAAVCTPFVEEPAAPQRVRCQRVAKYLPELFTFVADPAAPADNNAAKRSLRPVAVRRKISGGTRSAAGTATRTTLWSLVDTWRLQGQDVFAACRALLTSAAAASV